MAFWFFLAALIDFVLALFEVKAGFSLLYLGLALTAAGLMVGGSAVPWRRTP